MSTLTPNRSSGPFCFLLVCAFILSALIHHPDLLAAENSPDTLRISLGEAEQVFIRNNSQLLAARFNVDAARAATIQAGLWSNPNLSVEQNVYNQFTHRYFDVTKSGNTDITLQQLILLGGKRGKQVNLAEINTRITESNFSDLLRRLKLELRTTFYDLSYLQQSLQFYDESIRPLRQTLDAVTHAYENRAILLSEMLRLKALVLTLESERLDVRTRIADLQGTLHTLLRDTSGQESVFMPMVAKQDLDNLRIDTLDLNTIVEIALDHRPDVRQATANVDYEMTNLALQKAMAIPDVTVGGTWSRNGSYIPNYYALTVAIDLPFLNRNQGNIEVSERMLDANRATLDHSRQTIRKEVSVAYEKAVAIDRLYQSRDRKMTAEYRELVEGMIANYQKRNMTIIEFTDFFESYRTSMIQLIRLENDRIDALEELNYTAGSELW